MQQGIGVAELLQQTRFAPTIARLAGVSGRLLWWGFVDA
jgi:hypothetical protein